MSNTIQITEVSLFFLPVEMRVPLKFGNQVSRFGDLRPGPGFRGGIRWFPSQWLGGDSSLGGLGLAGRFRLRGTAQLPSRISPNCSPGNGSLIRRKGHPMELGHGFIEGPLESLRESFNGNRAAGPGVASSRGPGLFFSISISPFTTPSEISTTVPSTTPTIPIFFRATWRAFLEPATDTVSFEGKHLSDFLVSDPPTRLPGVAPRRWA